MDKESNKTITEELKRPAYSEDIEETYTKKREKVKDVTDEKKETLIPLEDYIKCAVHLGTKVITPNMRKFVYKRRADGLAVINTALIDERLREAISFVNNYEVTIICDPWLDKNALHDSAKLKKPILSLCDTNNYTNDITKIIPCNNKSKKSIGCILFILAREYCKHKKIKFNAVLTDFTGELEALQ